MLQVNASVVMRYEATARATIVGRHNRDSTDVFRSASASAPTTTRRSPACRAPARPRGSTTGAARRRVAEASFRTGYRSTAAAPIVVARRALGRGRDRQRGPAPAATPRTRLGAFCELVSLAVASAQARADLIASRARLVKAGDEQRRRLERNLHDGAQQRLVSVALKLRVARAQLAAAARRAGAARARRRASSTPGSRSCASSRAACTRRPRRARARARARGARRAARRRRRRSTSRPSACPSTSRRPRTTSSPRR